MRAVVIVLGLVFAGQTAFAEPDGSVEVKGAATPNNAASLQVGSLVGRGLAGQFERRLNARISAVASLGARSTGAGDYDSLTLSSGGEARWWFTRRAPWAGFEAPAMVGLYLGARVDIAHTGTRDLVDDENIGSTLTLAEDASVGYRFAFLKRLEVTPSAGIGLRHEFDLDGRLPPWTRGSLSFGLTVGALF